MLPVLRFHRGWLRPVSRADAGFLRGLLNEPEVRRYLCDDKALTEFEVSALLSENEVFEADGLGLWVIETDTLGAVGLAGLTPVAGPHQGDAEMAGGIEPTIALEPKAWGQGLARAALTALIHYACDGLKLAGLVAAADAPNVNSHQMLTACGFERIGKTSGVLNQLILYRQKFLRPIGGAGPD